MNDLPEINFKGKKDDKKGFLPWLRSRFGFGGRGATGGAGEAMPGAANFGRAAFGAAKFGASSGMGLGGLLAGKFGLIAMVAVVGGAVGTTLYMKNLPEAGTAALSSGRVPDNYVPAILRGKQNQGSSLDMFKETNKGAISMDENAAVTKENSAGRDKNSYDKNSSNKKGGKSGAPGRENMAQEMKNRLKLAGDSFGGGFSDSAGGNSGKFSFRSSGVAGGKSGGSGNLNAGFQVPRLDPGKKLLAMKGSRQPVFSRTGAMRSKLAGRSAFNQASGLKATQQNNIGTSSDQQRSTQDKAWEGTTAGGTAAGGTGVSPGGAGAGGGSGIVTSPSLDNTSDFGGGGGGGSGVDTTIPEASAPADESPWAGLPQKAMMLIMLSAALSVAGGLLVKATWPPLRIAGMVLCGVAIVLAGMAAAIGIQLITQYGQGMMGAVYTLGGGVAMAAAVMGMTGANIGPITPMWMAAIAGIIGLLGSMMGGK